MVLSNLLSTQYPGFIVHRLDCWLLASLVFINYVFIDTSFIQNDFETIHQIEDTDHAAHYLLLYV